MKNTQQLTGKPWKTAQALNNKQTLSTNNKKPHGLLETKNINYEQPKQKSLQTGNN